MKFYPYKKWGGGGRAERVLAMLKGGDTKSFAVVLTWELEILAILIGGLKKFYSVLSGLDPRFSHFVASPPPSL